MIEWQEREHYTAEDLVALIRILRDPQTGCPWDRVQTHGSIRKNFLEEAYEAVEAIDADDAARRTGRRADAGGLSCGDRGRARAQLF
jgi:tetrapyrrole methylase family protein/MazG family protein